MEKDVYNLNIVAIHLHKLIMHDFPSIDTTALTEEQIVVVGSRYNRGTRRKLSDIIDSNRAEKGAPNRKYSEYGRTLIRRINRFNKLLKSN